MIKLKKGLLHTYLPIIRIITSYEEIKLTQ